MWLLSFGNPALTHTNERAKRKKSVEECFVNVEKTKQLGQGWSIDRVTVSSPFSERFDTFG